MMERFNYPNLQAVMEEDVEIFQLLEAESYGHKRDEREEMEEQRTRAEEMEVNRGE